MLDQVFADGKRIAETLCTIYRSSFGIPVTTLRPFTFTGPYQSLDNPWAINNFLRDAIRGNDIKIHGNGMAKRSYIYGSDAAFWTLAAATHGVEGDVYNMGGANPITHIDLAELILRKSNNGCNVLTNTLATGHYAQSDDLYPDLSHTFDVLDVADTRSVEQSIERALMWFAQLGL